MSRGEGGKLVNLLQRKMKLNEFLIGIKWCGNFTRAVRIISIKVPTITPIIISISIFFESAIGRRPSTIDSPSKLSMFFLIFMISNTFRHCNAFPRGKAAPPNVENFHYRKVGNFSSPFPWKRGFTNVPKIIGNDILVVCHLKVSSFERSRLAMAMLELTQALKRDG